MVRYHIQFKTRLHVKLKYVHVIKNENNMLNHKFWMKPKQYHYFHSPGIEICCTESLHNKQHCIILHYSKVKKYNYSY